MKSARSLKIYIASSARNLHYVQLLSGILEHHFHTVLDWTSFAPPIAPHSPVEARKRALDSDERGEIFNFCKSACGSADLLIYLGPAGQDAAAEIGLAHASGVPILGLASPLEAPGLILSRCVTKWCKNVTELVEEVELYSQQKSNLTQ